MSALRAVTTRLHMDKNTLTTSPFKPGRPLSPYKGHIMTTCVMIYIYKKQNKKHTHTHTHIKRTLAPAAPGSPGTP